LFEGTNIIDCHLKASIPKDPKIDIAFHNILILAFWGFFSERDTDMQASAACELPYPINIVSKEAFLPIKISFGTHQSPGFFNLLFFNDVFYFIAHSSNNS
jgi:hypothetical protein